ncbi:hypothetical protein TRAPUB_9504 [Trametes pubescens]|uniref:Uncharacterized protein n=1 Tax=Trametes pubescens TaxID=154538 RepID=A0A1M2W262_TRAPU|nr:hypothetical protein TRAPUB_9504 [Trametes pubescens]
MPEALPNGTGSKLETTSSSLEADIALLSKLLSQNADESDPDVVELLRRLEAAEGIADGVESRLDGIIDHLDDLLSDLETQTAPKQEESGDTAVAQVKEEVIIATSTQEGTN